MNNFYIGFEKRADEYYHRTHNLEPILKSGKILSLSHLAEAHPYKQVSVEPYRWSRERETLSASEAAKKMEGVKDIHNVFLTKDAPIGDEAYGKYIIKKELMSPKESHYINLIPKESLYNRPMSVKNSVIYAPKEELEELKKKYKGYTFKDKDEIKSFHQQSLGTLLQRSLYNIADKIAEKVDYQSPKFLKEISSKAEISGSTALGLNIPSSDVDIFVPFKRKFDYERAKKKLLDKGFTPSPYNKPEKPKFIFHSPEGDIALAYGPEALKRRESVEAAKTKITPEFAKEVREKKEKLQHAWFFKEKRYKKYKKEVDDKLGLYRFK